MKRRISLELSFIAQNARRFLIISAAFTLFGALVWWTAEGTQFVWKICLVGARICPFWLLFILWISAYFLYGASFAELVSKMKAESALKLLISYLISLFWCPLALSAYSKIAATLALCMSVAYLVAFIIKIHRDSFVSCVSSGYIILVQFYSGYITAELCF